jgi:hypothetical protein
MAARLVLCGKCSRHIKTSESICPFCGEGATSARPSTGDPFRRMAAAAAVAAGVATITGCSSGSTTVFYGSPGPINGLDAAGDSPEDAPSVIGFYGIGSPSPVPSDAGVDAPDATSDASEDASG